MKDVYNINDYILTGKCDNRDIFTDMFKGTFDICLEKTKIFRSWDNCDKLLSPSKIGNAKRAAPTYFPCVKIKDSRYIDGGVFANNPCLIELQEAHKLWGKMQISVYYLLGLDTNELIK